MEIYIDNCTDNDLEWLYDIVKKTVEESLRFEGVSRQVEVSVSFVSGDEIKDLNKQYRGIDSVTDVLSFPLLDSKEDIIKTSQAPVTAIGDIVICYDKAVSQAKDYGHSLEREIGFLTAHSILHLLGYDHLTEDEEKEMCDKQEQILCNLNLTRDSGGDNE